MTIQDQLINWYAQNARPLPWRRSRVTAYHVLVSEIMLQQTPAARVAPHWEAWIKRWPNPESLAAASPAEVIRQWDRLGYPNRALRLHESAKRIVSDHGGRLPRSYEELVALPGVGDYTASAILAFAYDKRSVVLDTNIRRVIARVWEGHQRPTHSPSAVERNFAKSLVPLDDKRAAQWSIAIMEFGAVVCTARNPMCNACPISNLCAWQIAGYPESDITPKHQKFEGTDRQVRGKIMKALKESSKSLTRADLLHVTSDIRQFDRALDSLVSDGLVDVTRVGRFQLPQ